MSLPIDIKTPSSPPLNDSPCLSRGRADYPDGHSYIGEFLNGKREGYGHLIHSHYIFEGFFKEDLPLKGKISYLVFNSYYQGEVILQEGRLLRHGKGYMKYDPMSWYDGDWDHDKRHGHGLYCELNGKYEGKWLNDQIALHYATPFIIHQIASEKLKP